MATPNTQHPLSTGKGAIFVLGLQRSGTTWIANMLAGSGAVATVTAADHRGVHESVFFSHFATAFGPWSDPTARTLFREAFLQSDYYILTGLDAQFLDATIAASQDPAEVFDRVMTRVARDQACVHWLEKSPHHTRLAEDLAARFPDALFVCILRDSHTLIPSRLAAYGRSPATGPKRAVDIVRGAMSNALASRRLKKFAAKRDRVLLLRYTEVLGDIPSAQARLVRFLELQIPPETLVSAFAPNTSHDRGPKTSALSVLDRVTIRVGDALGTYLPMRVLDGIENKRRARRGADWPEWVWHRSGWTPPDAASRSGQARTNA